MKYLVSSIIAVMLAGIQIPVCTAQTSKASDMNGNQSQAKESESKTFFNLPVKTFGGKQFWSDLVHLHGYRIQKNVVTDHHRLLSPDNVRIAWGSYEGCREKIAEVIRKKNLEPMQGRVLIIMHGLTRTRGAMKSITDYVESNSDLTVINVSYASTRADIATHAQTLASVIDFLPEVEEINFLGHSMGSIVVRYYLGVVRPEGDPRFRRMVMLAPPNKGSRLAKILQNNLLFKTFWGVSGQDLSKNWEDIEARLATPNFQFAIIAGGQPEKAALDNPLIRGKNDLIVTVEETRLAGATDFMQQHLLHSTMMKAPEVHEAALSFFENGWLLTEEQRQPIDKE